MSFKRDGDDYCLLNRLKHQRVTELLGSYIPDEEAKQLSNGRFTCLVCEYRPIFDSIKMLAVHRKGKKHLQELSKYIKRKSYLELESLKKEQQDTFHIPQEDNLSSPGLNPTFLGHKEYLALKLKRKLSDRRKTLELPTFINEVGLFKTKLQEDYQSGPSPASQVRRYLKQLPRKVSLEMMVEKKSGYPRSSPVNSPKMKEQPKKSLQMKKPTVKSVKPKNSAISTELSMNMSGWIKDKFGNWEKDPDAEFDSDDDNEPHPVFPT